MSENTLRTYGNFYESFKDGYSEEGIIFRDVTGERGVRVCGPLTKKAPAEAIIHRLEAELRRLRSLLDDDPLFRPASSGV